MAWKFHTVDRTPNVATTRGSGVVASAKSPPGAAMSTVGPYDEYEANRPSGPTADTDSACGYAAGQFRADVPELPAAATTSAPACVAALTTSCKAGSGEGPPRLRWMTRAPVVGCTVPPAPLSAGRPAAYRIPCATS